MGNRTPLFELHEAAGAKIVDFGGWDMPIHYGSQLDEHHVVRSDSGMFDVSHMTAVELHGSEVTAYLDRLLANDIKRLSDPGKAMYSAMLNESGHIIDDLIVYTTEPYLVVVNCATREKDLAWMTEVAKGFDCEVKERADLAIIAVQGPNAIDRVKSVVSNAQCEVIDSLKVYQGHWCEGFFLGRTGYTGERGLEIILPAEVAPAFWQSLADVGVRPIGLGARDTLRLEAGMNLYGSDMDESVTPMEANMAGTIYLEGRNFVGAEALQGHESKQDLVGLIMTVRGVLRAHYPVFSEGRQVGEITSGAFSPTLQHSIALARVSDVSADMSVEIRGKSLPVECVTAPFVRNGKQVYKRRYE